MAAGTTDYLDGLLARRLGVAGPRGARLDAIADVVLLIAVAACLLHLHPEIATRNGTLITTTAAIYAASLSTGLNLRRPSSKVAGACLYGFALLTFFTGTYVPLALAAAAGALILSTLETIVVAAMTINDPIATAAKQRSHAPHSENPATSRTGDATSNASSIHPKIVETR